MLRSVKAQRTKLQKKITEELLKAKELLDRSVTEVTEEDALQSSLETSLTVLNSFKERFESLSDKISAELDEAEEEVLDAESDLIIEVTTEITRATAQLSAELSRLRRQSTLVSTTDQGATSITALQHKIDKLVELQELQFSNPQLSSTVISESPSTRRGCSVRLPKIEFEKFSGDVLKFQEFWDSFSATIHDNASLRPVEKLNYLRTYLSGEAKQVISGISICDNNYDVAVELIKKRFGNPQASVDAHYSCLTNLSKISNNTAAIRRLSDDVEKHLRCLEALGEDVEHRHFISLIMSKLPQDVVVRLEESRDNTVAWSVSLLRQKLEKVLMSREAAERQHTGAGNNPALRADNPASSNMWSRKNLSVESSYIHRQPRSPSTVGGLVAGEEQSNGVTFGRCVLCKGSHYNEDCAKFKSIEERRRVLRGRCFICLKTDHQAHACRSSKPCVHCNQVRRHNRCLCPGKFPRSAEAAAISADNLPMSSVESSSCENFDKLASEVSVLASGDRVLLQTATIKVENPCGTNRLSTRVLLDCASNRSYISEQLASKLGIVPQQSESFSVVTFGSEKPKTVETQAARIKLYLKTGKSKLLDVSIVPRITGSIQRSPVLFPKSSFLWKDLPLADSFPASHEKCSVDFLIGNDYYLDLITAEKIEVGNGLYLLGSEFGWLLTGRIVGEKSADPCLSMFVTSRLNCSLPVPQSPDSIDSSVPIKPSFQDFWALESIGINDNPERSSDDDAVSQFHSSVEMVNGRYHVSWPWKDKAPDLPDNYQLALGCFQSLIRKFQADSRLFGKYTDVLKEQEQKGIIEKVPVESKSGWLQHYIPHHAVCNPTKATTKVRIVYDASAKVRKTAMSLNECLLRGPVILEDLCGLLLRFRMCAVGIIADIEKAFLQVGLHPADRDVTRFLWLKDGSRPSLCEHNLQVYRFCRVPFGIVSSPFLLAATLKYHLNRADNPTARKISRNLYVDNLITGVDCSKSALTFYTEAKGLLKSASMNLREWASNSQEFLNQVPIEDRVKDTSTKVLGLTWNTTEDTLHVNTCHAGKLVTAATKRQMLQGLASVFDPLGLFSPLTVRAKMFINRMWEEKFGWDDEVGLKTQREWEEIASELVKIPNFSIPRRASLLSGDSQSAQLICFCDASASTYATCVYLRCPVQNGHQVRLIFSKSRLAPSKVMTIPRMELLAVVIGVRCLDFVAQQLMISSCEKYLWTDSQCVLHWMNSKKPLPRFVENRLRDIDKHPGIHFKYVSSHQNPADIATRGQFTFEEMNSSVWWSGPQWLLAPDDMWPSWPYDSLCPQQTTELHDRSASIEPQLVVSTVEAIAAPYGISVENFSSLSRLYRVTAWMTRFIDRLRKRKRHIGPLQYDELRDARLRWDHYIQQSSFPEVFKAIRLHIKCNLKEQLNVSCDKEGLLRCYGRFLNSDLPNDAKFPKLLPRKGHYTQLLILYFHHKFLHSGVSHTLSQLRLEYWIPQGRSAVRSVVSKCLKCRSFHGGPYNVPLMPPLPSIRIAESSPFSHTGLDYLGPLYVKSPSGELCKVWVCLFTCMVIRAVHLEIVTDMSASQFLLCFRRFVARRGKPDVVVSDNATQFKLSRNVLQRLWGMVLSSDDVLDYVAKEGIVWEFIVERAPWMGGFYERLVGSVKQSLKKAIGRLCLTLEKLSTVVTEVEAVVNSRPLFPPNNDTNPWSVITPQHFLSLNPSPGVPTVSASFSNDPDYVAHLSSTDNILRSWLKGQKLLEQFWKDWRHHYLASLRERSTYRHKQPKVTTSSPPQLGDVVHIREDGQPRGSWKLGRVSQFIYSQDDQIRAVTVKLPSGKIIKRPIKLLYPLESRVTLSETAKQPPGTSPSQVVGNKPVVQSMSTSYLKRIPPTCFASRLPTTDAPSTSDLFQSVKPVHHWNESDKLGPPIGGQTPTVPTSEDVNSTLKVPKRTAAIKCSNTIKRMIENQQL